jgi:hypothetical protein
MGETRRRQPKRLAGKLPAIRRRLGVSETQMARLLELKKTYTVVSSYERHARTGFVDSVALRKACQNFNRCPRRRQAGSALPIVPAGVAKTLLIHASLSATPTRW